MGDPLEAAFAHWCALNGPDPIAPVGHVTPAGVWSPHYVSRCCLRAMALHPWSLMVHARSIAHVAAEHQVAPRALQRRIREHPPTWYAVKRRYCSLTRRRRRSTAQGGDAISLPRRSQ